MVEGRKTRTRRSRSADTQVDASKPRAIIRTKVYGTEEEAEYELETPRIEVDPVYVRVNAGVTKSIGDYESLRVDVSLSVPCYPQHVDVTFEAVSEKVGALLDEEVGRYLEGVE